MKSLNDTQLNIAQKIKEIKWKIEKKNHLKKRGGNRWQDKRKLCSNRHLFNSTRKGHKAKASLVLKSLLSELNEASDEK